MSCHWTLTLCTYIYLCIICLYAICLLLLLINSCRPSLNELYALQIFNAYKVYHIRSLTRCWEWWILNTDFNNVIKTNIWTYNYFSLRLNKAYCPLLSSPTPKSGPLRPKPKTKAVLNPNPSPIGTGVTPKSHKENSFYFSFKKIKLKLISRAPSMCTDVRNYCFPLPILSGELHQSL